jgi:hypothetical protein
MLLDLESAGPTGPLVMAVVPAALGSHVDA